jgi:hypothetical protein
MRFHQIMVNLADFGQISTKIQHNRGSHTVSFMIMYAQYKHKAHTLSGEAWMKNWL